MDNYMENDYTSLAESHKCLACGGNLRFSINQGELLCSFCGQTYAPELFEITDQIIAKDEEAESLSLKADKKDSFDDKIDKYWKEYLESQREIVCNSCGAKVRVGKSSMSTACIFCGSPTIIESRVQKEFRPDGIIPFKLSKADVEKNVKEWMKNQKFAPDALKNQFKNGMNFDKLKGIYVPTWLVDAKCDMYVAGRAGVLEGYLVNSYDVARAGSFDMSNVPFDGSRKIKDKLMEAIEPYDYNDLVEFSPAYLDGMYAECYDLRPAEMAGRIRGRFKDYMYDYGRELLETKGYNDFDLRDNSHSGAYKCRYVLLPVWVLQYTYKDVKYTILVNGQTGEVAGDTPKSTVKIEVYKYLKQPLTYLLVYIAGLSVAIGPATLLTALLYTILRRTSADIILLFRICYAVLAVVFIPLSVMYTRNAKVLSAGYSKVLKKLEKELQPDQMPHAITYITKTYAEYEEAYDDYIGCIDLSEKRRSSVEEFNIFRFKI